MDPPKRRTRKRKTADTADAAPPAKRTKVVRGKQGRLAGLLSISLDVVFEILGHLQPLDLLRISRLNKEFRALLLSKSTVTVWRACLNNVGLPLPPPESHMNEPQVARLAFDSVCQTCDATARKVEWSLLKRICSRCSKSKLSAMRRLSSPYGPTADDGLDLVLSRPDTSKPWMQVCLREDYDAMTTKLASFTAAPAREKFIQERKALLKNLSEYAILLKEWDEGRSEARSTELAELKEERYNAVVAKLTALGWGDEIESLRSVDDLRQHKLVRSPNQLTERSWKSIEAELVQYMQVMKEKRLAREFAALVLVRKNTAAAVFRAFKHAQLPWTAVMPGLEDFYEFAPIVALLKKPADVDVLEADFEALLPEFPSLITTWRDSLPAKVLERHADLENEDKLKLAKCVFKCALCPGNNNFGAFLGLSSGSRMSHFGPLLWPRVLSHHCLSHLPGLPWMLSTLKPIRWSAESLEFDKPASEVIVRLVELCGLDPETATVEEMDALDARFACHRCAVRPDVPVAKSHDPNAPTTSKSKDDDSSDSGEKKQPAKACVFTWRNAVIHERMQHGILETLWYKLEENEAAAVRVKEAESMQEVTDEKPRNNYLHSDSDDEPDPNPATATPAADDGSPSASGSGKGKERAIAMDVDSEPEPKSCWDGPLPPFLPAPTFSCAVCLDTERDQAPLTPSEMKAHQLNRHANAEPKENEDYYRALAVPEIYDHNSVTLAPEVTVMMPPKPAGLTRELVDIFPFGMASFLRDYSNSDDYSDDELDYGYGGYDSDPYSDEWPWW
ncbi:F-box domain-containing protein [Mycena chlorophos]|uniref:F-box domain-containing protein n=1 Tax=Mycena chlorophos TaxID=658473 RepID=A0A8H6W833_MYCCL|nr:F-box domain-containing protein [Mycena chlorophos]